MVKRTPAEEPVDRLTELKQALRVDTSELDEMLTQQPVLYHEVLDEHALAVSRRDGAKNQMERLYSELYLGLRKKTYKDKPSEAALKHMVETDSDYLEAQTIYFRLKKKADRWEALTLAFKDRSYMLREYANLQVTGYYMDSSGGKTRSDAASRVAEENKKAAGRKRGGGDDDD